MRGLLAALLLAACSRQPRNPSPARVDGGVRAFVREADAGLDFEDPEHRFSAHFPGLPTFEAAAPRDGGASELGNRDFTYSDGANPDAYVVSVSDLGPLSDAAAELDERSQSAVRAFDAVSVGQQDLTLAGLAGRDTRFQSRNSDGGIELWGEIRIYVDLKAGRIFEIYYVSAVAGAPPAVVRSFLDSLRIHR